MVEDARFEDADEAPLRLLAFDQDDLKVIAALAQDGVFTGADMLWERRARRFAILLNRFRWEDADKPHRGNRPYERVRSVLSVEDVMHVKSQGVDPRARDTVYELLDITFEPADDGAGTVVLVLAGDGAIALEVEALEVHLRDVTRPYLAPSGKMPRHE